MATNEETKALDFARWESDKNIRCDTPDCRMLAAYIVTVHATQCQHSSVLRCKHCMDQIHRQNTQVFTRVGALRCGQCGNVFRSLKDWLKLEKL